MFSRYCSLALALAALACAAAGAGAPVPQAAHSAQADDWCRDHGWGDHDRERVCEVREYTLRADRDVIAVDATPNGGIRVEGWDRDEILVQARVQAQARYEEDAREIVDEIEIVTGRTIRADGPRTGHHEGWSVSFRVRVPRSSNLELESMNGGITINEVSGDMRFRTTNGGLHLSGLAGDVDGRTINGGLEVELAGDRWDGRGLDVRTTNGGVKLYIPEDYSCRLESGTVNGSFRIDFPITVRGRIDRRLTAELGDGGTPVRAFTTNGSVVIRRS